jgi:hypothetical protein
MIIVVVMMLTVNALSLAVSQASHASVVLTLALMTVSGAGSSTPGSAAIRQPQQCSTTAFLSAYYIVLIT